MKTYEELRESLWANIHARRKSGKRLRKKGENGAPTAAQTAAFTSPLNQITDPVETEFGFHLIETIKSLIIVYLDWMSSNLFY